MDGDPTIRQAVRVLLLAEDDRLLSDTGLTDLQLAMTETEKLDLSECRWWTLQELEAAVDLLTPRDLATRLRSLLADGPPRHPIQIGI